MKQSDLNCEYAFDHDPGKVCHYCNLEVDRYGNTEDDFLNCSFPDCGCDGEIAILCGLVAERNMEKLNDKKADAGNPPDEAPEGR